jgi:hypothetical protein
MFVYTYPKLHVKGICLWPFIILREQEATVLRHEKIHYRQQLELGILPFYIWYVVEFCYRYAKLRDWKAAYKNICFEREAYSWEEEENYLKTRKPYTFLKYL